MRDTCSLFDFVIFFFILFAVFHIGSANGYHQAFTDLNNLNCVRCHYDN